MPLREVEKVEVTCLVDNNVDVLLPNTEVARRPSLPKNWYERPLIAEHGFSAAITLQLDGIKRTVFLDAGLDPLVAAHNIDVLGSDLSHCYLVISSHGHVDHAGGLLNVKQKIARQRIPLVLHEDAFKN